MKTTRLVDTNVLVYAFDRSDVNHEEAFELISFLSGSGQMVVTPQVLMESYNVLLGLGWQPTHVVDSLVLLESHPGVGLIYPLSDTHSKVIDKAGRWGVKGKSKIFDIFLAQTAIDNGVKQLYTYNTKDFRQFAELEVISPGRKV